MPIYQACLDKSVISLSLYVNEQITKRVNIQHIYATILEIAENRKGTK